MDVVWSEHAFEAWPGEGAARPSSEAGSAPCLTPPGDSLPSEAPFALSFARPLPFAIRKGPGAVLCEDRGEWTFIGERASFERYPDRDVVLTPCTVMAGFWWERTLS
jgi:hypothetical protein